MSYNKQCEKTTTTKHGLFQNLNFACPLLYIYSIVVYLCKLLHLSEVILQFTICPKLPSELQRAVLILYRSAKCNRLHLILLCRIRDGEVCTVLSNKLQSIMYRIAGNFRGEKYSWFSWLEV